MADNLPAVSDRDRFGQFAPGHQISTQYSDRSAITKHLMKELRADFIANGAAAIANMRALDPVAYVKTIVSLLPKEIKLDVKPSQYTDEELDAAIYHLAHVIDITPVKPVAEELEVPSGAEPTSD